MSAPRRSNTPEVYLPPLEEGGFNPKVQGVDYGVLDRLFGYTLRRAQIIIYEHFISSLAPWNITPPRFSALVVISRNPDLKLTDLANILGIARSGAVALINSLEMMGYVQRQPCPTDRRALGLALTDKGRADLDAIIQAVVQQDEDVVAHLSASEQSQLAGLLAKVAAGSRDPSAPDRA
jgi:DNA-binding MarR family transcriptional regulator